MDAIRRRLDHLIDQRHELATPPSPALERTRGTVHEVYPRTLSAFLDGAATPMPGIVIPLLAARPVPGDEITVLKRREDGLLELWAIHGRDAPTGSGMAVDVADFGADTETDNLSAFQRALGELPAGGTLKVRQVYPISDALTIPKSMTIEGPGGIIQMTAGKAGLLIAASDVSIRRLGITGPQYAVWSAAEAGISVIGTVAAPITRLDISGCRIKTFGGYGVYFENVHDFIVDKDRIKDVRYGGIMGLSVVDGRVTYNRVQNIPGQSGLAYGIEFTRKELGDLILAPRSRDILVDGNIVRDVPLWDGYGTHGGERITWRGNLAINCKTGFDIVGSDRSHPIVSSSIANPTVITTSVPHELTTGRIVTISGHIGSTPPLNSKHTVTVTGTTTFTVPVNVTVAGTGGTAGQIETWAPLAQALEGNIIDGGVDDGTTKTGIVVKGALDDVVGDAGPIELATGSLLANIISRCGNQADPNTGGIILYGTQGLPVKGNVMERCSPFGIVLWHNNYGFNVSVNTITDAWSDTVASAAGIAVRSYKNTGYIGANVYQKAVVNPKIATYVMARGLSMDLNVTTNVIEYGDDYCDPAIATPVQSISRLKRTMRAGIQVVNGPRIMAGPGSPEGVVGGQVGALYLRTDGAAGTSLYVKETGAGLNTGWVAK